MSGWKDRRPAALALRALQKLDELDTIPHRELLLEAETKLGMELGLACSGVPEEGGFYDHSSGTCPIHEWLVESDHDAAYIEVGLCPECAKPWDGRGVCPSCGMDAASSTPPWLPGTPRTRPRHRIRTGLARTIAPYLRRCDDRPHEKNGAPCTSAPAKRRTKEQ